MKLRVARALIALSILPVAGCGIDLGKEEPKQDVQVPIVDVVLNRIYVQNKGLVTNLDATGNPVRDGASMDETIKEARRFYDTLGAPNARPVLVDYPDPDTGAPPSMRITAPLTFDDWKRAFNIPVRNPGESLADYRRRADVVVYYNKNELGLGRELGCAEFDDGRAPDGTPLVGVACYVTNYGTAFRDQINSVDIAVEGAHAKNTVCISWRPSMERNYQVQFYTYNADGLRREAAALDTYGPRPLPQVCMNCHGGQYDTNKHLAINARFLPLDPNVVEWPEDTAENRAAGVTRAEQEERIRKLNLLSTRSPLTSQQTTLLDKLYDGKIAVAGTKSATEWAPDAWNNTPENRLLFDKVIQPNCTTCHAAMSTQFSGQPVLVYDAFFGPQLLEQGLEAHICNQFTMPNSQATMLNFWEPLKEPITTGGKSYNTAADLLLARIGKTRDTCNRFNEVSRCNRAANQAAADELCGNAYSGRACNMDTGQCVPYMRDPERLKGMPNGICKMDKSQNRGCVSPSICVESPNGVFPGAPGYDGVCMID